MENKILLENRLDQNKSKNFRWKYFFDNLVKYLPLYASIPILIGAFYQSYNLMSIGTGYLRFFSTSQLISDGLALFIPTVYIAIISTIIITLWSNENKAFLFVFPFFYLILDLIIIGRSDETLMESVRFWILISLAIIFIGLIVLLIIKGSDIIEHLFSYYALVSLFSFIYLIIMIFFYAINSFSEKIELDNFGNYQNIICFVKDKSYPNSKPEFLYFNDKYIFMELGEDNQRQIRIYPFDQFFNSNYCETK